MPIDKILEEEINKEIKKLEIPRETKSLLILEDLKSRIPQIEERIVKIIQKKIDDGPQSWMKDSPYSHTVRAYNDIINSLKGGKEN